MDSVNPLFLDIGKSFVRWALTLAAAFLVNHGVWAKGDVEGYVGGLSIAIVTLAWAVWTRYRSRVKFLTALASPAGTSEATVNAKIETGMGAKALGLFLVVAVAGAVSSCAGHLPANATPQMKIAAYADDAMKGVKEVQNLTASLEAAKVIKEADAAKVMIVAEKIGKGGESLARALAVYDGATTLATKQPALAEVLRILDDIDANIKALIAPLDATGSKAKYIDLVTTMVKSLWSVRVMLPVMGGA